MLTAHSHTTPTEAPALPLAGALDALSDGLLLADSCGRPLHANAALRALLEGDPERERVRWALNALVHAAVARLSRGRTGGEAARAVEHEVRTGRGTYRLSGGCAGTGEAGEAGIVVVSVRHLAEEAPRPRGRVGGSFGLTPKESEVALLITRGLSNAEIAQRLGISPYTARNHAERVLSKLRVQRRAAVATVLLGEVA